jgi:diguanylate cyclase (GGDEF)-like protein
VERRFGIRLERVLGQPGFPGLSAEALEQSMRNDKAVLASGQPAQFLEVVPTPDGRPHYWLVVKFPYRDSAGRTMLGGVAFDVTEQRALEARLAEQLRVAEGLNAELKRQRAELAEANARLTELSTSDELTGLKNYRHFRESLNAAFALSVRERIPLSLAMVDVDEFKRYNDDLGHDRGNDALRAIAQVLRQTVRTYDLVARYGGEEFAILMPSTGSCGALFAAERVRAAVRDHAWPLRPVTISLGIATMSEPLADPDSLIELADQALYHSKRQGRNRVTHYSDVHPSVFELARGRRETSRSGRPDHWRESRSITDTRV